MTDTRRRLLAALARGPSSGPALADGLGVTRAAVWKHVEALRDAGFAIEGTDGGYAVTGVPEYGDLAVEYGLDAPFRVEYHDAIDSTNDRARELAADGATDVVVLADEQTGGRGRLARAWSSPPGGVWLSLVLRPDLPVARASLLTLAAAVAVTRTARGFGVDAHIKWPNDVLVGDEERKLAGVLTEMEGEADRLNWVVVGVGVNANVPAEDLPDGATSLQAETGTVQRRRFVQGVLETFDDHRTDPDATLDAWRDLAGTLGRRVRVETPDGEVVGEAVDVTDRGGLVVRTDDGPVTVHTGECQHLRPA